MDWTITIKPTFGTTTVWGWTAVRADGENVVVSEQSYPHVQAARTAAQAAAQAYEDDVIAVREATITEQFTPEGVEDPIEPEPEP